MSSLDELFQWFGYAIVQQFDVEIAQFWTPLMNPNGFTSSHLRVMTMRTPSIPEQVLLNDQVILAVKSIEYEQRMIPSRPVEAFFSPRQAALLKYYGLHFCAGGFTKNEALLPPPANQNTFHPEPQPFMLTTLLYLTQRANWNVMPSVSALLKEVIQMATSKSFLLAPATSTSYTTAPSAQSSQLSLGALVVRRKENTNLMITDNPFSSRSLIPDKQANRLHSLIDGKKTVTELAKKLDIEVKDISTPLRILLEMDRVELLDASGRPLRASQFFPDINL